MKRTVAVLCLLSLCSLAPALAAAEAPAVSSPVLCDAGPDLAAALFAPVEAAVCPNIRCSSNAECAQACPSATSATCGAFTHACTYTFPGGGGGGGGSCPSTRCIDEFDCVCNGRQGVCIERACHY